MATYEELHGLMQGKSALRNKIAVAVVVAAETIREEDAGTENHANRLLWAAQAFNAPNALAERMLMAVLAANKSVSVATIETASDDTLQTAVDNAVDLFATGA